MKDQLQKLKEFNWLLIILPFTTHYKMKNAGIIHPMLILLDIAILLIPFSTIFVVLLIKYWSDQEE